MHTKGMLILLLALTLLLSACGGAAGKNLEPVSVVAALETLEENLGKEICVRGFPVAYFYSYNYKGDLLYSVYFSDTPEDFFGEIEEPEEVRENWVEVIVKEKDELWQAVKDVFDRTRETEELLVRLKGVKGTFTGSCFYDFLALQ